jgi:outer membrane protein assembly factor BamB
MPELASRDVSMRRLTILSILMVVLSTTAAPPVPTKVLTYPIAPTKAELDRVNLQFAWSLQLPADSIHNGIGVMQLIGNQLYVQMRDGTIVAVDAETGQVDWSRRVGTPYPVMRRLGYDEDLVLALDVNRLVALEKKSGVQRWVLDLPDVPVAPPMAGEFLMFVPFTNGRVFTYALPETTVKALEKDRKGREDLREKVAKIREKVNVVAPLAPTGVDLLSRPDDSSRRTASSTAVSTRGGSTSMALHQTPSYVTKDATKEELKEAASRPYFLSSRSPGFRVDHPVLTSPLGIVLSGNGNETVTFRRDPQNPIFKFATATPLAMAPAQYGTTAYFTCVDGTILAVDLVAGKVEWQFAAPSTLRDPLVVTEAGVFATMHQRGLVMIDRKTGSAAWFQPDAQLVLAVNKSYVYANDRLGRLLILDRVTGLVLAQLDSSKFNVPLINVHNDRLILAANDGSLICLHDRDLPKPLSHEGPKIDVPKLFDKGKGKIVDPFAK